MDRSLHFALVGGDARQRSLSNFLARDGHTVTTLALPDSPFEPARLQQAQCVVLPPSVSRDDVTLHAPLYPVPVPLSDVLDAVTEQQLLTGGNVTSAVAGLAAQRGLTIHDYLLREDLAIANAIPTAEGALQLAMTALPITIHHSRVLAVGFGRVGQCTAARFAALGACVTVAARSSAQLSLAESMGCTPLPLSQLDRQLTAWDLVINTVPAVILDARILARLGSPVLLELASPPGGFDLAAVKALGLQYISAPGLPGKVAPVTAARIIQKSLYHMLEELGL